LWAPGTLWKGVEVRQAIVPKGIRTPDRSAHSKSPVAAYLVKFPSMYKALGFSIVIRGCIQILRSDAVKITNLTALTRVKTAHFHPATCNMAH
jgi:hypothetical protein